MSYRCESCRAVCDHKRLTYSLYKQDGRGHLQIAREVSVCQGCKRQLDAGASLKFMAFQRRQQEREIDEELRSRQLLGTKQKEEPVVVTEITAGMVRVKPKRF